MKKINFVRPYQHEKSHPNIFAWIFAKIRKASPCFGCLLASSANTPNTTWKKNNLPSDLFFFGWKIQINPPKLKNTIKTFLDIT
jgi:hypothetical protein